ncbi:hypothetical protein PXNS11_180074 [Stutzerimonas xanthomarina]|nr:hypothetical protein PXNS11_180074 [Stutzerimonas xanthomarina]
MIEEAQRHDEAFALSSVGRTKLHQSALAGAPGWATLISLSMPFLARLSRAAGSDRSVWFSRRFDHRIWRDCPEPNGRMQW